MEKIISVTSCDKKLTRRDLAEINGGMSICNALGNQVCQLNCVIRFPLNTIEQARCCSACERAHGCPNNGCNL